MKDIQDFKPSYDEQISADGVCWKRAIDYFKKLDDPIVEHSSPARNRNSDPVIDVEVEEMKEKQEEETLYETSLNEKARLYDEMQNTIQGPLYKIFMQQMECKLNIMYAMHKGYGSISDHCKTLERLDYEILEHLARSLRSNINKVEEEAKA